MKIFILEDMMERLDFFRHKLQGHDLYIYNDVQEAIAGFEVFGPFDIYFIDHDLDQRVCVYSDEANTGYAFARYLACKNIEAEIIIHSMNPVGAKNIKSILPHARIIPFHLLGISISSRG